MGADIALFRPPSLEAGLQAGRGGCVGQLGGVLASWGAPSPCSRHPFTSSTGMSAEEVRMEGGQLLAWPFWAREVLVLGELWPKAALEWGTMPEEGEQGLPRELEGDGQAESSLWSEWVLLQEGDRAEIRGLLAHRDHPSHQTLQGIISQPEGLGALPCGPYLPRM